MTGGRGDTSGRRSRRVLVVLACACAALLIAGALGLVVSRSHAVSGPTDLRGAPVAVEAGTEPAPATVARMDAVTDSGTRFQVPSVGLDVALGELSMADGTITPPGFTSAYRVRNLGVSLGRAASGTVFVAMHSLRGGGVGPGNYLIDVKDARARLASGAEIRIGGDSYTVTGSEAIDKSVIRTDENVWADRPGRLVVLTCLQRPQGGPSVDNIVIFAQLER